MSSSMIITSLIISTIVTTAMAKCKDEILILIGNDSFLYACPSQQVPDMAEGQRMCKLLNDHFDELAIDKRLNIDPKKRAFKWADLPHPDTKENNQRLGEVLKEMANVTAILDVACWIGLKREAPTTDEEKKGAGWRNSSKWSWTNIVNKTVEHFQKWTHLQPDNGQWWYTKDEGGHELCVLASEFSGEVLWEDRHCEGKGISKAFSDGIRLVCQVWHMDKPEDPTTTTSEAGVTTTGSEASLTAIILAVIIITTVGRQKKEQEQAKSESTDYTFSSDLYMRPDKKMPPNQPGFFWTKKQRQQQVAITRLQGVQPKLRQEVDEAKCLIIVDEVQGEEESRDSV